MPTALLTILALIAFSANSLLCRMALSEPLIDPVSFTTLRLVSGALALLLLCQFTGEKSEEARKPTGTWLSAMALFGYAIAFSLAYLSLSTGTGALILFGSVQITMIAWAGFRGEKMSPAQWLGSMAAMGGLVYLVLPGLAAPDPLGATLMGLSGVAWGVYSIRGKGASAPVRITTGNFTRAAPLAIAASLMAMTSFQIGMNGALLALTSGVITSGGGYVIWYKALRGLSTTQASVVQLTVPVIAATAGVLFLSETITTRLVIASAIILGGVALAVIRRRQN